MSGAESSEGNSLLRRKFYRSTPLTSFGICRCSHSNGITDNTDKPVCIPVNLFELSQDSRFLIITYTIIQNITSSEMSGPLHGQCNYMEYKHKIIYRNIIMEIKIKK